MEDYIVKDIKLHELGKRKVEFAKESMKVLAKIRERFQKEKPFSGMQIGIALHVTKETAVLVEALIAGGAKVAIASCNPLSTQDEVASYLANESVNVYAYKGETVQDYYKFIKLVAEKNLDLTVDDGADLVSFIADSKTQSKKPIGGTEETTTGVLRLKNMERDGALPYPVVSVNDNYTKHLFDNYYGTGQSTLDGIIRATNILLAGKTVVVCGYGNCGKGVAERARGMGAKVIITEVDPFKALSAYYDGFRVSTMEQASEKGDLFVTVTGNKEVITLNHAKKMKKGAIISNSGHFNIEISVDELKKNADKIEQINDFTEKLHFKEKYIYLLAEGRLVNLAAAEGHPSEIMDMSFAGQALALEYVAKNRGKLEKKVYKLPIEVDKKIAELKLESLGVEIDELTESQKKYLESWKEGT